jgi:hypothetical protein
MSTALTINPLILNILSVEQLQSIANEYRQRIVANPSRKPSLWVLLQKRGITREQWETLKAILGDPEVLHQYLIRVVPIELSKCESLYDELLDTLRRQNTQGTPPQKTQVELLKVLHEIQVPQGPTVQSNVQVNLDLEQYLRERKALKKGEEE